MRGVSVGTGGPLSSKQLGQKKKGSFYCVAPGTDVPCGGPVQ